MKIVVDTSILIDHLRGGAKWNDFKASVNKNAQLFLPTIVIFELFSGDSTRNVSKTKQLVDLIEHFERIELTEDIAIRAGILSRDLKKTIQSPDYIIAASALEIGAEVVTLNVKHFEQIPGLNLYRI